MTTGILFRGGRLRATKSHLGCGHRTTTPELTLERVRPHLRTCGITRVANITGLDRIGTVPVVLAIRPNSHTLANSAGKGMTLAAASASAVMEGIELHHAENLALPSWTQPLSQISASRPHYPTDQLPLTKYAIGHPDLPIRWVEAFDLLGQREVAVPADLVGMRRRDRGLDLFSTLQMGSNGLASGNHLLEAICHGVYELIERDAIAVATLAAGAPPSLRHRRMDPTSIASGPVADLIGQLADREVAVALYDLTSDLGVPTYRATTIDTAYRGQGQSKGYGCHLDPQVALLRAITEAVQGRTVHIAGSRDDFTSTAHANARRGDNQAALRHFHRPLPASSRSELPARATTDTFHGDLTILLDRLREAGADQVLVADLTDPQLRIPVVRVLIPGLEGYMFPNYRPGARGRAARLTGSQK